MAGAISFNVLAALVPLFLFSVGITGYVLEATTFGDPTERVIELLMQVLPEMGGDIDLVNTIRLQISGIIERRTGLTVFSAILLVWFSTRLVGTLRAVLKEVFDVATDRSIVRGKIFDMQVVLVGGVLLIVNVGITTALFTARDYGVTLLGLEENASLIEEVLGRAIAFGSIWVLFLGIYRYLPARLIPWRTALIGATFAAVLHEFLKFAFGFYATEIATYSLYGNLITLAVFYFWIYYEAQVFILGGEFAQVWTMRRALRVRTRGALFDRD
jgi:membrane protein